MVRVFQHASARRDLIDRYVYLAESAGLEVAERFLHCAESTFDDLAKQPLVGAPLALKNARLAGIRKWCVKDFDNHLVFYLPRPNGVSIVRVLHAAQDWWAAIKFEP